MTINTPLLNAVAQPRLVIGAPYLMTVGNGGMSALLYMLTMDIVVAGFTLALVQGCLIVFTYKDPYFYQAWFARLTRQKSKTLYPVEGNRYVSF